MDITPRTLPHSSQVCHLLLRRPNPAFVLSLVLGLVLVTMSPQASAAGMDKYAWTRLAWSGADGPFLDVEKTVQMKLAAQSGDVETVINGYRVEAIRQPQDPLAVYQWAYAAYASVNDDTPFVKRYSRWRSLPDAMLAVKPPYTHQYMRLLFVLSASDIHLRWLGERLARAAPHDTDVLYSESLCLAGALAYHYDGETLAQTMDYLHRLIHDEPIRARNYFALGQVYGSHLGVPRNVGRARNAISAFHKYLALASPNDGERVFVTQSILPGLEYIVANGTDMPATPSRFQPGQDHTEIVPIRRH